MTELTIAVLAMAACVFGASSGAKLSSRRNYLAFRQGLSETALIPPRMLPAVSAGLAASEATTASALAVAAALSVARVPGSVAVSCVALASAIALTTVLVAGVGAVLRAGTRATCACFGAVSARTLNGTHLARNAGLLAALAAGLVSNAFRNEHSGSATWTIAIAVGAIMALLLIRLDDLTELFAPIHTPTHTPMRKLTPKEPG
jgi:hypothetical protein